MTFHKENIPKEMRALDQWVLFVKENVRGSNHPKKHMISVEGERWHKAKSTEEKDWSSFDKAISSLKRSKYDGMAFCLKEGIIFIDIDNSIDDNGNLSDFAKEMLTTFEGTYAEKSCSGHGIHIFLKGHLPKDMPKRNDSIGLEIYETKRFCCMTGEIISKTNQLAFYQDELDKAMNRYLPKRIAAPPISLRAPISMNDSEVLQRAFRSKSGNKIAQLYRGEISGYPSHSNADMAFLDYLVFYTRDEHQLDSIMRSSGLYREKWDEPRGDSTYGRITIERALGHVSAVYSGRRKQMEMT